MPADLPAAAEEQPAATEAEGAPPVITIRVRVKSRTGESYYRGSRSWPANAWARVEVTSDELALLSGDKWLDVIPIAEDETLDARDLTLDEQLAAALKDNSTLRAEIASLKEEAALEAATTPTAAPRRGGR